MRSIEHCFIAGEWRRTGGSESVDIVNPATEAVLARVALGDARDVDAAVAAARAAWPSWSAKPATERAGFLARIGEILAQRREEIARTITEQLGMPIELSRRIQADLPVAVLGSFAKLGADYPFEERVGNSLVVRESVGVVAAITPWNYPLHQVVAKLAPALAAGCTVIVKPSEHAVLDAMLLAEAIESCGLPPGVFNLVYGTGATVGEALALHPDVDMISFTGSTRAGRRVAELAARGVKRVALELGGKSPNLILEDADFERAIRVGVSACFLNSGQTCNALTRLLVPRERLEEATTLAVTAARTYTLGDPFDPTTRMGPLISSSQRERVRDFIRRGLDEGAQLVLGGPQPPPQTPHGYFVHPTIFTDVAPTATIAREEIFGPVLSVIAYDDEAHAVNIANDTIYGLAAAVWTRDAARARRIARRLRAGQVDVNGAKWNVLAPFGGFKQSGHGRELGRAGLEEFLETKSIQL